MQRERAESPQSVDEEEWTEPSVIGWKEICLDNPLPRLKSHVSHDVTHVVHPEYDKVLNNLSSQVKFSLERLNTLPGPVMLLRSRTADKKKIGVIIEYKET